MSAPAPPPVHLEPRVASAETDSRQSGEMPFLEHLGELRRVLLHVVGATLVGGLLGWALAPLVMEDLIQRTVGKVLVLSPLEAFNERVKLTLVLGLMLALPYAFLRIWSFVVPGLLRRERSLVFPLAVFSMMLFAAGVWVAYAYVLPLVVSVLAVFATPSMITQIRLGDLLAFFYNLALGCGLMCQLPLVTLALTLAGVVTPGALLRQWRYAVTGTFLLTAAVTPGDVVSAQVILGIPLEGLYFLSVGGAWLAWRLSSRRAAATNEEA